MISVWYDNIVSNGKHTRNTVIHKMQRGLVALVNTHFVWEHLMPWGRVYKFVQISGRSGDRLRISLWRHGFLFLVVFRQGQKYHSELLSADFSLAAVLDALQDSLFEF